jgi:FlaA1/EpsC-like NDP-sugar epimerase
MLIGGTGSVGTKVIETMYCRFPKVACVVVFSVAQAKQNQMAQHS